MKLIKQGTRFNIYSDTHTTITTYGREGLQRSGNTEVYSSHILTQLQLDRGYAGVIDTK